MAYSFGAGVTDKIEINSGLSVSSSSRTIYARVKLNSVNTTQREIAAAYNSATGATYAFFLDTFSGVVNNNIRFGFSTGSGANFPLVNWTSGFTAGSEHVLIATYDGSQLALYADADATAKTTLAETGTPDVPSSLQMRIGNALSPNTSSWDGIIYEVAYWDGTALDSSDRAVLQGGGTPLDTGVAPTHFWSFDVDASDDVGAADGTVTGATFVSEGGGGTETETLAPDAVLASSNLTGATLANIDEDPAANDGSWAVATSNNVATSIRVSFPTPSAALSGDQTFRALVRKNSASGSGTPTATLSLYENGSLISADTAENVTSTTGQVISYTWSSTGRTASQIECLITGTQTGGSPGVRASVDIGAVAWDATIEATGTVLVDWTPTGGITLAGSPEVLRAQAATGSGGITLAGTAVLARTVVQSVSGGVTFAGGAAPSRVWDVAVSGGVTLGGTAPASQGATYEVTPSGGVVLGGAASVAQVAVYTVTPSGGITLSGAVTVALVWEVAPAGGAVLGGTGSGAYSAVYTVTPDGGVVFGGTAAAELTSGTQEFTHTPTGGIAFSGAADASHAWAHTPAGGVAFAGAAETAQVAVYTVQPVGGLDLAGTASLARLWAVTGTSGVTLAGAAALNQTWVHAPTGGITFAGSAPVSTAGEFVYQPSGGVVFGGAAGLVLARAVTPSGGIAFDGAATLARVHAYLQSGGVVLGGGADVATVRVLTADGGVILDGDGLGAFVPLQLVFLSSVSGGDRAAVAVAGGDRGAGSVAGGTAGAVAVAAGDGSGAAVAGDNRAAVSVRGGDSRP